MKTTLDCMPCFLRQALDALRLFSDDESFHAEVLREVLEMLSALDLNQPPPHVAQKIHRKLRALTGRDPFLEAKRRFNRLAMRLLPSLREQVQAAPNPLREAARLSIAANVIDLGVRGDIDDEEVNEALLKASRMEVFGDWRAFEEAARDAEKILFLADNAGEVVIDQLLIEQLGPARVCVVVRGEPVLNDATMADAEETGLCDLVEVIENGSDAPGTILEECNAALQERFGEASLILSKGQGNFETLSEVKERIYFLLKLKCQVVADRAGLPMGSHVLLSGERRAQEGT